MYDVADAVSGKERHPQRDQRRNRQQFFSDAVEQRILLELLLKVDQADENKKQRDQRARDRRIEEHARHKLGCRGQIAGTTPGDPAAFTHEQYRQNDTNGDSHHSHQIDKLEPVDPIEGNARKLEEFERGAIVRHTVLDKNAHDIGADGRQLPVEVGAVEHRVKGRNDNRRPHHELQNDDTDACRDGPAGRISACEARSQRPDSQCHDSDEQNQAIEAPAPNDYAIEAIDVTTAEVVGFRAIGLPCRAAAAIRNFEAPDLVQVMRKPSIVVQDQERGRHEGQPENGIVPRNIAFDGDPNQGRERQDKQDRFNDHKAKARIAQMHGQPALVARGVWQRTKQQEKTNRRRSNRQCRNRPAHHPAREPQQRTNRICHNFVATAQHGINQVMGFENNPEQPCKRVQPPGLQIGQVGPMQFYSGQLRPIGMGRPARDDRERGRVLLPDVLLQTLEGAELGDIVVRHLAGERFKQRIDGVARFRLADAVNNHQPDPDWVRRLAPPVPAGHNLLPQDTQKLLENTVVSVLRYGLRVNRIATRVGAFFHVERPDSNMRATWGSHGHDCKPRFVTDWACFPRRWISFPAPRQEPEHRRCRDGCRVGVGQAPRYGRAAPTSRRYALRHRLGAIQHGTRKEDRRRGRARSHGTRPARGRHHFCFGRACACRAWNLLEVMFIRRKRCLRDGDDTRTIAPSCRTRAADH